MYFRSNVGSVLSHKTPEDKVLQLKRHMLKLIVGDPMVICKTDPRTGILMIDLTKMHKLYLQEHEPQAILSSTGKGTVLVATTTFFL